MCDRCPCCGQPVRIVTDDDGTSHYERLAEAEVERLHRMLTKDNEAFADAGERLREAVGIRQQRDTLLAIIEGLPEPPYAPEWEGEGSRIESREHSAWREAQEAAKRIREPAGGNRLDQTASSSAGREHATQEGLKQEDGLVEHP